MKWGFVVGCVFLTGIGLSNDTEDVSEGPEILKARPLWGLDLGVEREGYRLGKRGGNALSQPPLVLAANKDTAFDESFSGPSVGSWQAFQDLGSFSQMIQADHQDYYEVIFDDNASDFIWTGSGQVVFVDLDDIPMPWSDSTNTFAVGYWGDPDEGILHSAMVTPVIQIPSGQATLDYAIQFFFPGDANYPDKVWVTTDTNLTDGLTTSSIVTVKDYQTSYISSLSVDENELTSWMSETIDISSFGGQNIRIGFELKTNYGEAIHIDNVRVTTQGGGGGTPAASRFVSHVSKESGGFRPMVIISNLGTAPGSYVLTPYDQNGSRSADVSGQVPAGSTRYYSLRSLFGKESVSHFTQSGDDQVMVTVTYESTSGNGSPVHVHAKSDLTSRWKVFPGRWDAVWDGVAVVNVGQSRTDVMVSQVDGDNGVVASQTPFSLASFEKGLYVFATDFSTRSDCHFEISANQQLAITALRGSLDNLFLWENVPCMLSGSPVSPGELTVFFDDFSGDLSNWDFDVEDTQVSIQNGAAHLIGDDETVADKIAHDFDPQISVDYQVECRIASISSVGYALNIDVDDSGNPYYHGYRITIYPNNGSRNWEIASVKVTQSGSTYNFSLVNFASGNSAAIRTGSGEWNAFAVSIQTNGTFNLMINGQVITTLTKASMGQDLTGIDLMTWGGEIIIDDVAVKIADGEPIQMPAKTQPTQSNEVKNRIGIALNELTEVK